MKRLENTISLGNHMDYNIIVQIQYKIKESQQSINQMINDISGKIEFFILQLFILQPFFKDIIEFKKSFC